MICMLRLPRKRADVSKWLVPCAGCSFIAYACYAIIATLFGGILLWLVATSAQACAFIHDKLFIANEYRSYPRIQSIMNYNFNVTTECLSGFASGNWSTAMNLDSFHAFADLHTKHMSASVDKFISAQLSIDEIDQLYENYTMASWMYFIDKQKTVDTGEAARLNVFKEVLNSGVQWVTVPNILNSHLVRKYTPNVAISTTDSTLYGTEWMEDKINIIAEEYADESGYANWCMCNNPNGCSESVLPITKDLNINSDAKVLTVYASILEVNPLQAELWANTMFWAVEKCKLLQSPLFPCRSLTTNSFNILCTYNEFSPYLDPQTTPDAAAVFSNIIAQTKLSKQMGTEVQKNSRAHQKTWEGMLFPYLKNLTGTLDSLKTQHCRVGLFDYMFVITGQYCAHANPFLGYVSVFILSLVGISFIGWIYSYKIWHYLYDRGRLIFQLEKNVKILKDTWARRKVEATTDIYASDDIADMMQELADGELDHF